MTAPATPWSVPSRSAVGAAIGAVAAALLIGILIAGLDGARPLAILAALGTFVLLLRWPDAATIVVVFAIYLNVPAVATQFYGVPGFMAAAIVGLLAVPLGIRLIRREAPVFAPALPFLIAYLGVLLVSLGLAHLRGLPGLTEPIEVFLTEGVLIFVLITNVVRSVPALRRVVWTLLVAGSVMGALSVHQGVTESYHEDYGGFAQAVGRALTEEADDEDAGQPRVSGPIGEKNRYAQVMLVLLPLALFLMWIERARWLRIAAGLATALILGALVLTFSRGAAVGLLAVLLAMFALRHLRLVHGVVVLLVIVTAATLFAPTYGERIGSIAGIQGLLAEDAEDPDGSILGRTTSNLAAFNVFLDHPLLGVGPGMYTPYYSLDYANELGLRHFTTPRRAHNLYLESAAEIGAIGLGALLAIVAVTLAHLWRARQRWLRRRPELSLWATAFGLSIVGYLVTAIFLHLAYQRYFWLLIALANATIWILAREQTISPDVVRSENAVLRSDAVGPRSTRA